MFLGQTEVKPLEIWNFQFNPDDKPRPLPSLKKATVVTTGTRIKPFKVFRIPQSSAANPSTHPHTHRRTPGQTNIPAHSHIQIEAKRKGPDSQQIFVYFLKTNEQGN